MEQIWLPGGMQVMTVPAGEDPSAAAMERGPGWAVLGQETEEGLPFAVSLPLTVPLAEAQCFPHLAALCACEAIGGGAVIHWPCDIMLTDIRLCTLRCRAGEGVIAPLVTLYRPAGEDLPALAADIAGRLWALGAAFPAEREARLQAYCDRCVTLKKGVDFLYRGVPMNGYAFAVDRNAALMVMTESRTVLTLRTGPVRLAGPKDAPDLDLPNPCRA